MTTGQLSNSYDEIQRCKSGEDQTYDGYHHGMYSKITTHILFLFDSSPYLKLNKLIVYFSAYHIDANNRNVNDTISYNL